MATSTTQPAVAAAPTTRPTIAAAVPAPTTQPVSKPEQAAISNVSTDEDENAGGE
jgi:hypothetical protein